MWLPISLLALAKLCASLLGWLAVVGREGGPGPLPSWVYALLVVVFGATGTYLIASGRHDRRAVYLGACQITFVSLFADRLLDQYAAFHADVLRYLSLLRWEVFAPAFLWNFAQAFLSPRDDVPKGATTYHVSLLLGAVLFFLHAFSAAGDALVPFPGWASWLDPSRIRGPFWVILALLAVPPLFALLAGLRSLRAEERRRVSLFVAGLVIGTAPMVADVLLHAVVPAYAAFLAVPSQARAVAAVIVACICVLPLATAYAVMVGKVFDLRVYVRKAIQYALARYTVLALLALHGVGLSLFVWQRRGRPLESILAEAPDGVGLLFVSGLVLLVVRGSMLTAIDKRFFREQYDARRILLDLSEGLRGAAASDQIASLVSLEIDRALHVGVVSLLTRDAAGGFTTDGVATLPAGSALARLLEGSTAPLDVDLAKPRSTLRRLPAAERNWLVESAATLLVPLLTGRGLIGILVLGEKRSETPYTSEDRDLLTVVAASAALALENNAAREAATPAPTGGDEGRSEAFECPRCGRVQHQHGHCGDCAAPLQPALLPSSVGTHFEVSRRIGRGGMGVVYRGRDLLLNRKVAIKTLPRLTDADATRLRREARAMAALRHPHLATIYGADAWRGYPLLFIEYLEGGTVADRLRTGTLTPAQVIALGRAMAQALEYLHAKSLLHRDVKPSNIGYTSEGVPKLLDFGLVSFVSLDAARADAATATATAQALGPTSTQVVRLECASGAPRFAGTPAYMSPEAIGRGPARPADDLWALAVTLYEALTQVNPMKGEDLLSTVDRVCHGEFPDPRGVVADCPPALSAFFEAALARDASRRPPSATVFHAALGAIQP